MGNTFIDVEYMQGGGNIGILRPGLLYVQTAQINAYTQEHCVIRFARSSGSYTATIKAVLSQSADNTQETYIDFGYSDTQYYDITEPLRAWTRRNAQGTPISPTATHVSLAVTEYDSVGGVRGEYTISFNAYDAPEPIDRKFGTPLPDSFRMLADNTRSIYQQCCARSIASYCDVDIILADGTTQQSYSGGRNDLYTAGWRFLYNPLSLQSLVRVGVVGDKETARVDWIACAADKAQVRWWSPEAGGYKSVVVELLSVISDKGETAAYYKAFDNVWASALTGGVKARIPLCTMRDVMYYRDIFASDEVEMLWSAGVYSYAKRVKVDGAPPEAEPYGTADIEMTLRLSEVSEAW